MKTEKRKLMAERMFLFDPNIYMNVIFTIEGDVTSEALMEAVKKTYTQNQTTLSKVVIDKKGDLYLEKMEQTGCGVYIDSRSWQEIRNEQERIPFRINEGELIRTFLIPKEKTTDVYLMAHHLMCDASGMLVLVEDIMDNLTGKEVAYKPTKVLEKRKVIHRGDLKFNSRLLLRLVSLKWKKERKVFSWEDYYRIHEAYWKNKRSYVEMTTVEGDELAALKRECKALNVTVNSYLTARILRNYPDCKKLGIPVSLRGKDRSVSNLIASVEVFYQYDPSKSFEENVVLANRLIRSQVESEPAIYHIGQFLALSDPTLVDAALMHHVLGYESDAAATMAKIIGYIGSRATDMGITNLREIKLQPQYGDLKITDIIGIPPNLLSTRNLVSIFTYRGKMTIATAKMEEI